MVKTREVVCAFLLGGRSSTATCAGGSGGEWHFRLHQEHGEGGCIVSINQKMRFFQ